MRCYISGISISFPGETINHGAKLQLEFMPPSALEKFKHDFSAVAFKAFMLQSQVSAPVTGRRKNKSGSRGSFHVAGFSGVGKAPRFVRFKDLHLDGVLPQSKMDFQVT